MKDELLLIPGPTQLSSRVREALGKPQVSHQSPEFFEAFSELLELTKFVFKTRIGYPYVLTGSGSLAMEAAVVSLLEPNDKVLVLDTGHFGSRFGTMAEIQGCAVMTLRFDFGKHADVGKVEEALSNESYKAVFMTHVDTSTTICNPIRDLCKVARRYGAVSVVDSVCGLGGAELEFDEWGIDIALTGSQKALAGPPGLSLLSVSKAAMEFMETRRTLIPSYYLSLLRWKKVMDDVKYYLATPAVNLFLALREAMREIKEEGLERRLERHKIIAQAFRAGIEAMAMGFVAEEGYRADTVTGIYAPGERSGEIQSILRSRFQIHMARGLYENRERIVRVAHFGNITSTQILSTLSALELTLRSMGLDVKLGSSTEAAGTLLSELPPPQKP